MQKDAVDETFEVDDAEDEVGVNVDKPNVHSKLELDNNVYEDNMEWMEMTAHCFIFVLVWN